MQMEIDLTDVEIAILKSRIGELDPVAQAEAVVKYLGKSCTQEQLGERLGKTRDWIAKRVQFIRALGKLPKSEQKETKKLVRHRTVSILPISMPNPSPTQTWQGVNNYLTTVVDVR